MASLESQVSVASEVVGAAGLLMQVIGNGIGALAPSLARCQLLHLCRKHLH